MSKQTAQKAADAESLAGKGHKAPGNPPAWADRKKPVAKKGKNQPPAPGGADQTLSGLRNFTALIVGDMDEPTNIERPFIRAIDLCAGAGGWACAARGLPIRITHAFDFWPVACKTYELNHPGTKVVCGDLRDPAVQDQVRGLRGQVDLVVGGIPCEWLSVYRNVGHDKTRVKAGELIDQRKTLDDVLDLVRYLSPRWWCLEDVKGLAKELPPLMAYRVIDAAGYGPQRRKRVFVGEFPAPLPGECKEVLRDRLRPGPYRIGGRTFDRTPVKSKSIRATTCYAAYPGEKAPTVCPITSRRDAELAVIDPALPGGKRQMEWQEAARLQGFPEDYLFYGSPTDVFLQVGRAIQIDLGRAILTAISAQWKKEKGLALTHA